jgi:hypothetical protein
MVFGELRPKLVIAAVLVGFFVTRLLYDEARKRGRVVISMKKDWKANLYLGVRLLLRSSLLFLFLNSHHPHYAVNRVEKPGGVFGLEP